MGDKCGQIFILPQEVIYSFTNLNQMKQYALTLNAQIIDQNIDQLKRILKEQNQVLKTALESLGTIHYARWVIIDKYTLDGEDLPAQLVFSSNFDGSVDQHFQDLDSHLGDLLNTIYENCEGYTPNDRVAFLKKTRIKEAAFYQGSPGRTVGQVKQERALRDKVLAEINGNNWSGKSAKEIHRSLQDKVLNDPQFEWAKTPAKVPGVNYLGLLLIGILLLILAPFLILWAVFIHFFYERRAETMTDSPNQLNDAHMAKMVKDEDFFDQNQFSQIMDMQKGLPRLITVNFFYLQTRLLVKVLFVKGKLMGIPTIHFARWIQVNDKRRMLFFSNFDGSWTQYLGDFIDKSGWGLNAIFGNTIMFPKTYFLFFGGAYDERHFLAWSRKFQISTQLWYTVHQDLSQSIKNINNNTIIRNELSKNLSEKQAEAFLARI